MIEKDSAELCRAFEYGEPSSQTRALMSIAISLKRLADLAATSETVAFAIGRAFEDGRKSAGPDLREITARVTEAEERIAEIKSFLVF